MNPKIKNILKIIGSILVVVVCMYLSVQKAEMSSLVDSLSRVNVFHVIISALIIVLIHWVKTIRWRTLLEPALKNNQKHSLWNLFSAMMIGYAVNNATPMRFGEVLRPYIYSRKEKISFSTCFATILAERFIDILSLALLFGFVFLLLGHKILKALPDVQPISIIIPSALVIGVLILSFYPPFVRLMLQLIIKPLSEKMFHKLNSYYEKFIKGFAIIKTPSQYLRVTLETSLIWVLNAIPMWLMFFSFSFQNTLQLGFNDAIILTIVSGVIFSIAPTPGAMGVYHWLMGAAITNLYRHQISHNEVIAYCIITHSINYFVQTIIGGVFFLKENIKSIPKKEELA